jgi:hypothetical protein
MKNSNMWKIYFDVLLLVVFLLDYNTMMFGIGGPMFHEISGLIWGGLLIIHMTIDWKWIKHVTLNLFGSNMPSKTTLQYWMNTTLFLMIIYIFVSGVACSALFPSLHFGNLTFMKNSHKIVSFLALILLGTHLGLDWKWVMSNVKKIFGIRTTSPASRVLGQTTAFAVLALGVYLSIVEDFWGRIIGLHYDHSIEYPMVGMVKMDHSYNPLYIIVLYASITAVFAVLTYYIEKSMTEGKAKRAMVKSAA